MSDNRGRLRQLAVDLDNCAREPIHIPGAIQPHGILIVIESESWIIRHCAGRVEQATGRSAEQLVGQPITALMPAAALDGLNEVKPAGLILPHSIQGVQITIRDRPFDLTVHRHENWLMLELEPVEQEAPTLDRLLEPVQTMPRLAQNVSTVEELCALAADQVRDMTGFDRVMVYRFLEDGSGEVLAESRADEVEPFLGLRYPASDIPPQARELYRRNWLRLIADVDYEAAPLVPPAGPDAGKPLDMTHCVLRSVSPIHVEYLKNMGVKASMSISVLQEDRLWGLIACHHYAPCRVPWYVRVLCQVFATGFSFQVEAMERNLDEARRRRIARVHDRLSEIAGSGKSLAETLFGGSPNLLDLIDADGAAAIIDGEIGSIGVVPDEESIRRLADWLDHCEDGGVFATSHLGAEMPHGQELRDTAAGVIAISVSRTKRDYVLWFRRELVQTVHWAGDPAKAVSQQDDGSVRLSPRKSFETWRETTRNRSRSWDRMEIEAAARLRSMVLETVLRQMEEISRQRAIAEERQKLLMAELDHRVKNTLANIQSLVLHTGRRADSVNDFVKGLERRIRAMSHAHSLLTQTRWEGAHLGAIVLDELQPYRDQRSGNVVIRGPEMMLRPKAALAFSLAIHELTTNASKYGALSVYGGRVEVRWEVVPPDPAAGAEDRLVLVWTERGGPPIEEAPGSGFGRTVIERSLAFEVAGEVDLRFEREGVVCEIRLPMDQVIGGLGASRSGEGYEADIPDASTVRGKRILVVEDSAFVVMSLEAVLDELECELVGPANRLGSAMRLAAAEEVDGAILDINLDGGQVFDLAYMLRGQGVPFLFATGYAPDLIVPSDLQDAPSLRKPFDDEQLRAAIINLFRSGDGSAA